MERANIDATGVRDRRGFSGAALLLALPLLGCAKGATLEPRSALLVTLDTARYEAVSCFGEYEGITPFLDRLAEEALRFDSAYTVAPLTLPAHASMLTGLTPLRHGVRENGSFRLPDPARTLAELASEQGIETAAVVGAVVLDETFGLAQGFESYDAPPRPHHATSSHVAERLADEVVDRALAWFETRDRDRPYFLWLHFFDPHAPYLPPPEFRSGRFAGNPYFGEVAFVDRELARLFAYLEERKLLEETTVLIVADHGEAFGEHGETTHGLLCYQPTLHVPLLLRSPDRWRAGERERRVVSVVDVFPTMAEALGITLGEAEREHDGVSLFRSPGESGRGVYFESYTPHITYGWAHLAGWIDEEGKYLHGPLPEFFDLRRDPGETGNLLGDPKVGERDMGRYLAEIAQLSRRERLEVREEEAGDSALLGALQSLGYGGISPTRSDLPDPLTATDRAAPQFQVESYARLLLAQEQINRGSWPEAGTLLEGVLAEDPENYFALDRLAVCLIEQGRAREAIAPLKKLLRERPRLESSHFNLAICLEETGRIDEAIEHLTIAVELRPGDRYFRDRLVALLEAEGREEAAAHYRAKQNAARDERE
jgi:choline-sulfatase